MPTKFSVKPATKKFAFKCKKCAFCCTIEKIVLYPFDIMNICSHLNIPTSEFLDNYASFLFDDNGILRCSLRTNPICKFNKKTCTIYEARPVRCRTFPVGRYFEDGKTIYLLPDKGCTGFESGKKQTIKEWIDQIPNELNEMAEEWNNFLGRLKKSNLPFKDQLFVMFFRKIFYDFDNELVQGELPEFSKLDTRQKMQALYEIADKYFSNFDKIKTGFEKLSKKQ